jgi:Methyltransferase domain
LHNITFSQSDISQVQSQERFDAAVGRFILQFLPDPASVLRALVSLVRPGGIIAFHEPQWDPYISLLGGLPLSRACAIAVRDIMRALGVRMDSGLSLYNVYQQAGLPPPSMYLEMILGAEPGFTTWVCDLLFSLLPKARQYGIPLEALGNLETLSSRVHAEVTQANTVVPWIALVAAWSRVPTTKM